MNKRVKIVFFVAEDTIIRCVNWILNCSHVRKSFFIFMQPPQVTGNVRGNIKMPLYKFTSNIKFRLT